MAKKDTPIFAFLRKGNSLVPEMDYDLRALDGVAQNQRVRFELKKWRNVQRLRAYWKTLHECIDATGCATNATALHNAIKLETGLVEHVRLGNGLKIAVASSIAIDALSEADMIKHFMAAEEFMATEYGFSSEYKPKPAQAA